MHSLKPRSTYRHGMLDKYFEPIAPYCIEFVGTCLLVFVIGTCSVQGSSAPLAALSIGFTLVVLVFFGGHISGAHYNPAVTIGIISTLRSQVPLKTAILYTIVQVFASFIGALLVYGTTKGGTFGPMIGTQYEAAQGVAAEIIGTFLLVTVVLNVATTEAQENNSFFGIAIGFTVGAMAIAVGGISGGAFNPAVGTGPHIVRAIFGLDFYRDMWIYWVGPLVGCLLAAGFFRMTNVQEYKSRREHALAERKGSVQQTAELIQVDGGEVTPKGEETKDEKRLDYSLWS